MDGKVLCNRIRLWRAEKRISQGELAKLAGVSRQTISSVENLQFCPSAKLALSICQALGKRFEDVFYFSREETDFFPETGKPH